MAATQRLGHCDCVLDAFPSAIGLVCECGYDDDDVYEDDILLVLTHLRYCLVTAFELFHT